MRKILFLTNLTLSFVFPAYDSLNVRFVGGFPFGGCNFCTGGSIEGQDYFIFNSGSSIVIMNVENPSNPTKIGHILSPIPAWPFLKDSILYLAGYDRGLLLYDVKNPSDPLLLGQYQTNRLYHLFVQDTFAFCLEHCSSGFSQLIIFNVSNPANPFIVSTWFPPDGYLLRVYVEGSYAYLSARKPPPYTSQLFILDISTITAPVLIGVLVFWDEELWEIKVVGDYLYFAPGVGIIDVSDPTNPYFVSRCLIDNYNLEVDGQYAYGSIRRFSVVDVSNPYSPFVVGEWEGGVHDWTGYIIKIGAFVYGTSWGMNAFDVSEPFYPFKVGEYYIGYDISRVKIAGNIAVVGEWFNRSIRTIDITYPNNCVELDRFDIIDQFSYNAPEFAVKGNYVFVANLWAKLMVLDISDPANIRMVGQCNIPNSQTVVDVAVQGNYAYILYFTWNATYAFGVVNIADPSSPYLVSFIPDAGGNKIFVSDNYAFCATNEGLRIIDITYPSNPMVIGVCSLSTPCYQIYVSGNYAYLGGGNLYIVDISNPYNPFIVSQYPAAFRAIFVDANLAYLASATLRVLDVSNPANPYEVGYYVATNLWGENVSSYGVYYANGFIYLATGREGLWILRYYGLGISENITHPLKKNLLVNTIGKKVKISYTLNKTSPIKISLIDVVGRVVYYTTVNNGPGLHNKELYIPGLSTGVYFLRVETVDWFETEKIILLND